MNVTLDADGILECPTCGSNTLHHETVTVWFRDEDADIYSGYRIGRTGGRIVGSEGNPSARRDGMTISFWCENSDHRPQLDVIQHKGSTFVEWRE